jgi:hypothetical protein
MRHRNHLAATTSSRPPQHHHHIAITTTSSPPHRDDHHIVITTTLSSPSHRHHNHIAITIISSSPRHHWHQPTALFRASVGIIYTKVTTATNITNTKRLFTTTISMKGSIKRPSVQLPTPTGYLLEKKRSTFHFAIFYKPAQFLSLPVFIWSLRLMLKLCPLNCAPVN